VHLVGFYCKNINVYFYYPTNTTTCLVYVVYLILLHVSAVQVSYQQVAYGYPKSREEMSVLADSRCKGLIK